jgi:glyoxylase I family protein
MPFAHVALTVTDVAGSVDWYERLLDASKVAGGIEQDHEHAVLVSPDGLVIGLHRHGATANDDTFREARVGLDHVAIACSSRTEIEDWQRKLDELGVVHSGITESKFGHHLNFRDPDNIPLEFFAPLS